MPVRHAVIPGAWPRSVVGSAAALLATALFGATAEGATRWVAVGGLSLQPSLILLPPLLLAHVARPDRWTSTAVAIAALVVTFIVSAIATGRLLYRQEPLPDRRKDSLSCSLAVD